MLNIFTMGVYGLSEKEYFNKLIEHNIDTFCDIRRRRGVRGTKYSFVNSKRLQSTLAELGIKYLYIKELAPPNHIRNIQKEADQKSGIKKRSRAGLSEKFTSAYEKECLARFDSIDFINTLGPNKKNVLLFCVESLPEACHRSIVAKYLKESLDNISIKHL